MLNARGTLLFIPFLIDPLVVSAIPSKSSSRIHPPSPIFVAPNSPTNSAYSSPTSAKKITGYSPRSRLSQKRKRMMFSPRSANYERLETGLGPSRINGLRRFGWKKFAVGAVVIIGLVWIFGPRKEDIIPQRYIPSIPSLPNPLGAGKGPSSTTRPLFPIPPSHPTIDPPHYDDNEVAAPPKSRPTSPATDPDLTKTVHCTKPHKPNLPLVQYALMIDAGSTGSRIHIYKFNNCGASPEYEYEVFEQTKPGLSSYAGRPDDAAKSLDVLLDKAIEVVPEHLQKCTPVAVKATAGLRLLGQVESTEILDAVRGHLHSSYPFALRDEDGVVIMDGKDEGVYAWITANYLLDTIRASTPAGTPAYAVLDLGGASTQIVFEPVFDSKQPDSTLEEGEHKYDLKFSGKDYVLYQHSYLGYGLMRARKSVHRLVDFMASFHKQVGEDGKVPNPCLAKGTSRTVEVEGEDLTGAKNVTMVGTDIGSYEACNRIVELVMAKDAICEVKPCSFNGVYQPSLLETFPNGKILLLSYFYDRIRPLLPDSPSTPPIKISTLATLSKQLCSGKDSWKEHWGHDDALMIELEGRPEWCLDMTFMHALLRLGYEFDEDRQVEIGKQIDGTELGWCLGATIAMVGAELKCRV